MKAAIIGLPQSGKSTLFTAATSLVPAPDEIGQAKAAIVRVPDARLAFLAKLYAPKKITEATIELVDVPGFAPNEAKGRDDFRRHLPGVRQSDALVAVIRDFHNPAVPAYRNRVNRDADLNELWDELKFVDLETVTNRIEKLEKALTKPTKTHDQEKRELTLLSQCREVLERGAPLSAAVRTAEDAKILGSFALLTEKPLVVVYNVSEDRVNELPPAAPPHSRAAIQLCAETESQIAQLDPSDRPAFLADLGIKLPARDRLIQTIYAALGYISFLTAGPEEVRAWTIRKGTTAHDAAGEIHSDIARGFIRAETVAFDELVAHSDMKGARAAGKVRQEGKTYVVHDGDVILFKFNV
ncbi:MAG TPA: DUF933 domain-containing protein [Phycisphaerae bacterium]|jgi:hypothetical protein